MIMGKDFVNAAAANIKPFPLADAFQTLTSAECNQHNIQTYSTVIANGMIPEKVDLTQPTLNLVNATFVKNCNTVVANIVFS